jgi:hypothetical protein
MGKFYYLKFGLSLVLASIGTKMQLIMRRNGSSAGDIRPSTRGAPPLLASLKNWWFCIGLTSDFRTNPESSDLNKSCGESFR